MTYVTLGRPALSATITLAVSLVVASPALAGKPKDESGTYLGNGAPSGPHFNLIFNAKQDGFTCPPPQFEPVPGGDADGDGVCDPGDTCEQTFGNVIFMPREQGDDAITVVMESGAKGPKSQPDATQLEVTDWCTESFPDENGADGAVLRLPKDPEGYAVFGWVKGKLGERTFETVPSLDLVEDEAGNDLLLLGLVSPDGVFKSSGIELTRIDSNTKGNGKNNFTDMTDLFLWTGSVCYVQEDVDMFCLDESGVDVCQDRSLCCVDETDPPDGVYEHCEDLSVVGVDPGDGTLVCPDFDALGFPYETVVADCRDYEDDWVFNIADFVNVLWDIQSNAYNVQIRFYPLPLN